MWGNKSSEIPMEKMDELLEFFYKQDNPKYIYVTKEQLKKLQEIDERKRNS